MRQKRPDSECEGVVAMRMLCECVVYIYTVKISNVVSKSISKSIMIKLKGPDAPRG